MLQWFPQELPINSCKRLLGIPPTFSSDLLCSPSGASRITPFTHLSSSPSISLHGESWSDLLWGREGGFVKEEISNVEAVSARKCNIVSKQPQAAIKVSLADFTQAWPFPWRSTSVPANVAEPWEKKQIPPEQKEITNKTSRIHTVGSLRACTGTYWMGFQFS